jgi:hypothetical protein
VIRAAFLLVARALHAQAAPREPAARSELRLGA